MVGVPGRSKACNTCRKRRISCTLERPQCAQCVKSNRVCAGYQRERIFIQHQEKVQDRLKASNQAAYGEDIHVKAITRNSCITPLALRSKDVSHSTLDGPSSQITIVKEVHPTFAFQQQLMSEFLYHWLPGSDRAIQQRRSDEEDNWLMLLPEIPMPTIALQTSILAVCTAKLGRIYDAPLLVKESTRLYGRGLWELQKALWDPKQMYMDETLAACMALSMYEIIECPDKNHRGWLTHSDGCSRLMRLRGPEAYHTKLGHCLFRSCRHLTLIQSITEHRFTYLSDPEWCNKPWKAYLKRPSEKLVDVFAEGVNIVAQADELAFLKSTNFLKSALKIMDRCWKVDSQLLEIYKEIESSSLGPLYWPKFSRMNNPANDPELGKVFPVALHFLNLQMASACLLYWSLCIILWSGLTGLYYAIATIELVPEVNGEALSEDGGSNEMPSQPFDMRQLPPLEHRSDIIGLIQNICQSFEFCMQDEMRSMGPSVIMFPLQIAIENLEARPQNTRELRWAKAALEMIVDKGFRIAKVASSNR